MSVLCLSGCIDGSDPERVAKLIELEARIEKLAAENLEAIEKYKAGTLTAAEFKTLADANISESKALRDEVSALKNAGITVEDALMVGAAGGVVGRTLIHGGQLAVGFLPPPWGPALAGLFALLLGGSKTTKGTS